MLATALINLVGLSVGWDITGHAPSPFANLPPMPPGQSLASLLGQIGWGWIFLAGLFTVSLTIAGALLGVVLWLEAAIGYAIARLLFGQVPSTQETKRLRERLTGASEPAPRPKDISGKPPAKSRLWAWLLGLGALLSFVLLFGYLPGASTLPLTSSAPRTPVKAGATSPSTPVQAGGPAILTPFVPALPQSLRSCSSWDDFLKDARTNVDDYWLHQPFPFARPYSSPTIALIQPGEPVPCGALASQRTSFYCQTDRTIYLDQQSYGWANSWAGYAGLYQALAHEWTHHVQYLLGVPTEGKTPDFELQADCGSGMFLAAAWPTLPDGDLQALRRMLASTSSDPLHGSPEQRVAAFDDGYLRGPSNHCGLPLAQAGSSQVQSQATTS
jgi:hypothetical protein